MVDDEGFFGARVRREDLARALPQGREERRMRRRGRRGFEGAGAADESSDSDCGFEDASSGELGASGAASCAPGDPVSRVIGVVIGASDDSVFASGFILVFSSAFIISF